MLHRVALALLLTLLSTAAMAADSADVSLKTPGGTLWGSLGVAGGEHPPAALIIAGSGPTDRDGNGPTIHPNSYRLLADALAAHGITTLRTDKRGVGASVAAAGAESDLRFETFVTDAAAWAADLKQRTGTRCVWLIGHSEGALIAELVAKRNRDICGVLLLAGPGRNLGDIIRAQLKANPANPPELIQSANAILDSLETGQMVADVPPLLAPLFRPSVQPYLISLLPLDPAQLLAGLACPVLIVQGDTDLQVSVGDDANRLAAAQPHAHLVILPGVNHILKNAPADRAANFATYTNPALPLGDGVADTVASFILGK